MRRAFIGLFGVIVGVILLLPSFLIQQVFIGQDAVGSNTVLLMLQVSGLLLMVAFPATFWVALPFFERRQRELNRERV